MTALFVPTDEERKLAESMAGYGVPHENIAALIRGGIDSDTLKKHFKTELAQGKAKANAQIGKTLFQKAIGGDTTAAIWWTKSQMKWSETVKQEVTGADGVPLGIKVSFVDAERDGN